MLASGQKLTGVKNLESENPSDEIYSSLRGGKSFPDTR